MSMVQAIFDVPEEGSLTVVKDRLTRQAYLDLCAANPDLRIEREAGGEVIVMAPAHSRSSNRNFYLNTKFGNWVLENQEGLGYDSSGGFDLPNGANRSPDVAWVRKERLRSLPDIDLDAFIPLCPDFVIELRSRTDRLPAVQAKMREYIENGSLLGWLIDPITKRIWVYRPNKPVVVLEEHASISGDHELPGFTLHLAPIRYPEH